LVKARAKEHRVVRQRTAAARWKAVENARFATAPRTCGL
jgi:hypothetical protein